MSRASTPAGRLEYRQDVLARLAPPQPPDEAAIRQVESEHLRAPVCVLCRVDEGPSVGRKLERPELGPHLAEHESLWILAEIGGEPDRLASFPLGHEGQGEAGGVIRHAQVRDPAQRRDVDDPVLVEVPLVELGPIV